jgi:serine/threonine protein kinase
MAPEVMADLTYGPPADVFSLGATAFFLVTGKQMFFRPGETFFLPQWDDAVWETLPGEARE